MRYQSVVLANAVLLTALSTALSAPLIAQDDEPPPKVLSRQLQLADGSVHDAILPGGMLDAAPFPGGGVAVLIIPEDATAGDDGARPRALYRIRGADTDTTPIVEGLPEKLSSMVGRQDSLWLGQKGEIHRWPADGRSADALHSLLKIDGLSLAALKSRRLIPDDPKLPIPIPQVGRLTRYREDADGLKVIDHLDLPMRTRRLSRGFELWSPPVVTMHHGRQVSSDTWGTLTESLGAQRARSLIIRPDAAEDDRIQESWFRFQDPEDIQQHYWTQIDGRTALIVATTPGDKLGIFQKLKLRVFYASKDRTRAGRGPTTAFQTVSRRWYSIDPSVHEVTGDGKDDLVVVQQEGMGGDDLVVDIFPGKGNGRFEDRRPRRTKLKDQGGRWHFGTDFNGDQRPDLAVSAQGRLSIYAIDPSSKRKALKKEPFFTLDRDSETEGSTEVTVSISAGTQGTDVETISARGKLRIFDTNGDLRPEIVMTRNVRGRAVIRVITIGD